MSSYINKKTRVFRKVGDEEPDRKRSDGRMKTYLSATDARAWCDITEDQRQYILELVRKGWDRPQYVGKLLTVQDLIKHFLQEKPQSSYQNKARDWVNESKFQDADNPEDDFAKVPPKSEQAKSSKRAYAAPAVVPEKNEPEQFVPPKKKESEMFTFPERNEPEKFTVPEKKESEMFAVPVKNEPEKFPAPEIKESEMFTVPEIEEPEFQETVPETPVQTTPSHDEIEVKGVPDYETINEIPADEPTPVEIKEKSSLPPLLEQDEISNLPQETETTQNGEITPAVSLENLEKSQEPSPSSSSPTSPIVEKEPNILGRCPSAAVCQLNKGPHLCSSDCPEANRPNEAKSHREEKQKPNEKKELNLTTFEHVCICADLLSSIKSVSPKPSKTCKPYCKSRCSTPKKEKKAGSVKEVSKMEIQLIRQNTQLTHRLHAEKQNTESKLGELQSILDKLNRDLFIEKQKNDNLINRYTNQTNTVQNMQLEMELVRNKSVQEKKELQQTNMNLKHLLGSTSRLQRGPHALKTTERVSIFKALPHICAEVKVIGHTEEKTRFTFNRRVCHCRPNSGGSSDSYSIDE